MQRQINKSGDVILPVSFLGKTVEIEIETNEGKKVLKRLVKARGYGAYITLSRKWVGKMAVINTKGLFSLTDLKDRYSKGEYLSKAELLTIIDAQTA